LALFIRIVPKVGPLRALRFHTPTPETENLFVDSVNKTVDQYRTLLAAESAGRLQLVNENLDLGEPVISGKYKTADTTYAELVEKLSEHDFNGTPPQLRSNILAFYKDGSTPIPAKKHPKEWQKLQTQIATLESFR
jgi:hypothetical protein